MEGGQRHELATSNTLAINYLQLRDAGWYECEIRTDSGVGRDLFELEFSTFAPKYGDESFEGDLRVKSEHEVSFFFIENDVRPFGQVVVLCESSKFGTGQILDLFLIIWWVKIFTMREIHGRK